MDETKATAILLQKLLSNALARCVSWNGTKIALNGSRCLDLIESKSFHFLQAYLNHIDEENVYFSKEIAFLFIARLLKRWELWPISLKRICFFLFLLLLFFFNFVQA